MSFLLLNVPQKRRNAVAIPLTISGLAAWYDFSDITKLWQNSTRTTPVVANNDPIGACDDKSGNARHILQTTDSARPTYKTNVKNNLSAADFDGSNDRLFLAGGSFTLTQVVWLFVVVQSDDAVGSASHYILNDAVSNGVLLVDAGATNRIRISFGINVTSPTDQNTSWHLHSIKANGASSLIRLDGAANHNGSAGSGSFSNEVHLGANAAGALFWNGHIGEALIYDANLSNTERDTIETYLKNKWGIV